MKLPLFLLALLPLALCTTPSSKTKLQKRHPQDDDPAPLFDEQQFDSPPNFLPPPWSPESHLDSPYPPLSGVTPWDDSGRSQMLDNEPSVQMWRTCPEDHLDCRKCIRDPRCRRPNLPFWDLTDTSDEPQIAGDDDSNTDDKATCPLDSCDAATSCGEKARCVRNHCVCETGFKGAEARSPVVRGLDSLQAVTVWVDPAVACDVPCDSLSCAEVEQVEACFRSGVESDEVDEEGEEEEEEEGEDGPGEEQDWTNEGLGPVELGTASVSGGAIQVPGAVLGEGGDFVAGVADSGLVGEEN